MDGGAVIRAVSWQITPAAHAYPMERRPWGGHVISERKTFAWEAPRKRARRAPKKTIAAPFPASSPNLRTPAVTGAGRDERDAFRHAHNFIGSQMVPWSDGEESRLSRWIGEKRGGQKAVIGLGLAGREGREGRRGRGGLPSPLPLPSSTQATPTSPPSSCPPSPPCPRFFISPPSAPHSLFP